MTWQDWVNIGLIVLNIGLCVVVMVLDSTIHDLRHYIKRLEK